MNSTDGTCSRFSISFHLGLELCIRDKARHTQRRNGWFIKDNIHQRYFLVSSTPFALGRGKGRKCRGHVMTKGTWKGSLQNSTMNILEESYRIIQMFGVNDLKIQLHSSLHHARFQRVSRTIVDCRCIAFDQQEQLR